MTISALIKSLREQARDKELLAHDDADSIFAQDAQALREAAELLEAAWEVCAETEKSSRQKIRRKKT